MKIFYEVRTTNKRVFYPLKLVPAEEISNHTGFVSQYGYPEEVASKIRSQQGTFDLAGLPLYSDNLYIDFDDDDEAAWKCANKLSQYEYKMYSTGGRGFHIVVGMEDVTAADLPQRQKAWVKRNCNGADYNIYKSSAVIRLPGTWHAKHPGRQKKLIRENAGKKLWLPMMAPTASLSHLVGSQVTDVDELNRILNNLLFMSISVGTVGRNNHAFKIAAVCRDLGMDGEEAFMLASTWSEISSHPPLRPAEISATVKSAYRKRKQA